MQYDIFISYKRKSLPTANNLYYRLTTRGYSTFFDLEEMRRDNFNTQLLNYIDNAKDVFVILEEGSLDACKEEDWSNDWFCHEISYALEKKKNIIPLLIGGYKMPSTDFLPDGLKELSLKNAPEFNFSYFEEYLDKLIKKDYLLSTPNIQDKATSVFKFYSNENCEVLKDGKLVCSLEGMSEEPYYLPVPRKGDYRFKVINSITADVLMLKQHIDAEEEKEVEVKWESHLPLMSYQEWPEQSLVSGDNFLVDLGCAQFNMIRVPGGEMMIGATQEQGSEAEINEYPAHTVSLPTYYIGQFPITQNIWEIVMGYNKSTFRDRENHLAESGRHFLWPGLSIASLASGHPTLALMGAAGFLKDKYKEWDKNKNEERSFVKKLEIGHYPAENLSYDDALEFVRRLSKMTNIHFSLPTEEEWEYAARGGQMSKGYRFAGSDNIHEVAWYKDNSDRATHPVGEKTPNELGIYDMCGNVWEWTETPEHSYANGIEANDDKFIRRGGSWWHEAKNCRVSHRYASHRTKKTSGLGLRVVIRENVAQ